MANRPRPPHSRPLFWILFVVAPLVCIGGTCPRPLRADSGQDRLPSGPARRDVEVAFANGDVHLVGTLLLPRADRPIPAVVFVHGAASHERRENLEEADYFARHGIAALVYDKRGCGASPGDWTTASQFDLAEDALAAVRLLQGRPEIDVRHIGLWGMSQGAGIIPLAAVRSADVAFLIAVSGCLSFDRQMYYYRANLFRECGLSDSLLDMANKASLVSNDFARRVRGGLPVPSAWRALAAFDADLDYRQAWSRVRQPVLAVYGELDQAVPVAESAAALREAMLMGNNNDWTIVIFPGASHSLGKTATGALYEPWRGYVPGFLEQTTGWVLRRAHADRCDGGGFVGTARETALPYPTEHYQRLFWHGNSLVQLPLALGFALFFSVASLSVPVGFLFPGFRWSASESGRPNRGVRGLACALCLLNLALLVGLVVLVRAVSNQIEPACPTPLRLLPLAGILSALLTVLVLGLIAQAWHSGRWVRSMWWWAGIGMAGLCFVPFLLYWNVLGAPL
jgi:dienelactone hydrolase